MIPGRIMGPSLGRHHPTVLADAADLEEGVRPGPEKSNAYRLPGLEALTELVALL